MECQLYSLELAKPHETHITNWNTKRHDFRPECSSKSNRDRTSVETLNDFIRIRMKLVCMQVYAAMSLISIDAALLFSFLFFFFFVYERNFIYLFIYFFFINVLIEFFDLIRTNEVRENIFQYWSFRVRRKD